MSTEATSPRITADDLITRLRKEPQNLQVWVEAPDSPDGFLPLDGRIYTVYDSEPTSGDPHKCLVLALSKCVCAPAFRAGERQVPARRDRGVLEIIEPARSEV